MSMNKHNIISLIIIVINLILIHFAFSSIRKPPPQKMVNAIGTMVPIMFEDQKPVDDSREMIHIKGPFCKDVKESCKIWKEDPIKNKFARCLEYNKSVCIGETIDLDFWIDKYEHVETDTQLPVSDITWTAAKALCESEDRRLCSAEEWTKAAEGPEMYPYTTGLTRPTGICNIDLDHDIICGKKLCDNRRMIKDNPECVSGYGVVDMAGNVDEWIQVPLYAHSKQRNLFMPSALAGGHWLPIRARTRPKTYDHEEKQFSQVSIGVRCCKDAEKSD